MLNPDDKRDTVEQLNDSAKSPESSNMFDSYRNDTKFNYNLSQEKEELTKIREFQIIQGEEKVKRVLDHITTNCKSGLLLYGTKNLLSVILEIIIQRIIHSFKKQQCKYKIVNRNHSRQFDIL